MKTRVAHRAWSSVPERMDPFKPIRPIKAIVVFSRLEGKTCLYRNIFFVQRFLRGSSRKGKENTYPVVKITPSMFSSTVPSSKIAEVSVNSFTPAFILIIPQRIQAGSSSFTMNLGLSWEAEEKNIHHSHSDKESQQIFIQSLLT